MEAPHTHESEEEIHRPNLFTRIFTQPVAAVKWALENAPETFIHRHFILIATAFILLTRLPQWLAEGANPIEVLILVLVIPSVTGIILSYIFAAVIRNGARWLYQKPVHKVEVRTVVAWSHFPFAIAYFAALAVYCLTFLLRDPEAQQKVFTGTAIDFVPLAVLGLGFVYALYVRWRVIKFLYQISWGQAILLWLLAFIGTYGPAFILLATYVAVYVRSMEWLKFKFGVV